MVFEALFGGFQGFHVVVPYDKIAAIIPGLVFFAPSTGHNVLFGAVLYGVFFTVVAEQVHTFPAGVATV